MPLKLPSDFAKKISETQGVEEYFDVYEEKDGFFYAKLKPKRFLDKSQFKTMCALVRDLGGESYLQGMKAWKVPGPCAKKSQPQDTTSTPSPLEPRSKPEATVAPHVLTMDKTLPYAMVPVDSLLSMPFQSRLNREDPEVADLAENIRAMGVLQPILVRPKPSGLYEIVAGERRLSAAKKVGMQEVPVIIRVLDDEVAFVVQLSENLQRKDLTEEEKARALGELARRTGWNAQQIADKLKMSYTWVVKYLPEQFKDKEMAELGKLGAESKAELQKDEDLHVATRRVAEESEDMRQSTEAPRPTHPEAPQTVTCAHCGNETAVPIHFNGKYYCSDYCVQTSTKEKSNEDKEKPVKAEPVDFAEVTCPVCNETFRLIHHGPHDHRPEYYGGL